MYRVMYVYICKGLAKSIPYVCIHPRCMLGVFCRNPSNVRSYVEYIYGSGCLYVLCLINVTCIMSLCPMSDQCFICVSCLYVLCLINVAYVFMSYVWSMLHIRFWLSLCPMSDQCYICLYVLCLINVALKYWHELHMRVCHFTMKGFWLFNARNLAFHEKGVYVCACVRVCAHVRDVWLVYIHACSTTLHTGTSR